MSDNKRIKLSYLQGIERRLREKEEDFDNIRCWKINKSWILKCQTLIFYLPYRRNHQRAIESMQAS